MAGVEIAANQRAGSWSSGGSEGRCGGVGGKPRDGGIEGGYMAAGGEVGSEGVGERGSGGRGGERQVR